MICSTSCEVSLLLECVLPRMLLMIKPPMSAAMATNTSTSMRWFRGMSMGFASDPGSR